MASATSGLVSQMERKKVQHKFFVIEVSEASGRRYPTVLFGYETLDEALKLCRQMNLEAGSQRFAVRGPNSGEETE